MQQKIIGTLQRKRAFIALRAQKREKKLNYDLGKSVNQSIITENFVQFC